VTSLASCADSTAFRTPRLPWPARDWREDGAKISQLADFLQQNPPTGDFAWCNMVEEYAARLWLQDGAYWDDTKAAGYRMLTSYHQTPAALRDLPLGDRLWLQHTNEELGYIEQVRDSCRRGCYVNAVERVYQLAYAQYLGQRNHPRGIQDADAYMSMVPFCSMVPVGVVQRFLPADSDLLLAPCHPGHDPTAAPKPVRSLTRPRTQLAEVSHILTPSLRSLMKPKIARELQAGTEAYMAGIIPFSDMNRNADVGTAYWEACKKEPRSGRISIAKFVMDAARLPVDKVPHAVIWDANGRRWTDTVDSDSCSDADSESADSASHESADEPSDAILGDAALGDELEGISRYMQLELDIR